MAYLRWDIDTSIFGVYSLTTLPSHYGDFMRQPSSNSSPLSKSLLLLPTPLYADITHL